jgi:hypothetical protein
MRLSIRLAPKAYFTSYMYHVSVKFQVCAKFRARNSTCQNERINNGVMACGVFFWKHLYLDG